MRSFGASVVLSACVFFGHAATSLAQTAPPPAIGREREILMALRSFDATAKESAGPERVTRMRAEGVRLRSLFELNPTDDLAIEAGMMAQLAFQQAEDIGAAMEVLELVILHAGADKELTALDRAAKNTATPSVTPGVRFKKRISLVESAFVALAKTMIICFDHDGAERVYAAWAAKEHLAPAGRTMAASNALVLSALLGDRARYDAARALVKRLDGSSEAKERLLFVDVHFALGRWDARRPDGLDDAGLRQAVGRAADALFKAVKPTETNASELAFLADRVAIVLRTPRDTKASDGWCSRAQPLLDRAARAAERFGGGRGASESPSCNRRRPSSAIDPAVVLPQSAPAQL